MGSPTDGAPEITVGGSLNVSGRVRLVGHCRGLALAYRGQPAWQQGLSGRLRSAWQNPAGYFASARCAPAGVSRASVFSRYLRACVSATWGQQDTCTEMLHTPGRRLWWPGTGAVFRRAPPFGASRAALPIFCPSTLALPSRFDSAFWHHLGDLGGLGRGLGNYAGAERFRVAQD